MKRHPNGYPANVDALAQRLKQELGSEIDQRFSRASRVVAASAFSETSDVPAGPEASPEAGSETATEAPILINGTRWRAAKRWAIVAGVTAVGVTGVGVSKFARDRHSDPAQSLRVEMLSAPPSMLPETTANLSLIRPWVLDAPRFRLLLNTAQDRYSGATFLVRGEETLWLSPLGRRDRLVVRSLPAGPGALTPIAVHPDGSASTWIRVLASANQPSTYVGASPYVAIQALYRGPHPEVLSEIVDPQGAENGVLRFVPPAGFEKLEMVGHAWSALYGDSEHSVRIETRERTRWLAVAERFDREIETRKIGTRTYRIVEPGLSLAGGVEIRWQGSSNSDVRLSSGDPSSLIGVDELLDLAQQAHPAADHEMVSLTRHREWTSWRAPPQAQSEDVRMLGETEVRLYSLPSQASCPNGGVQVFIDRSASAELCLPRQPDATAAFHAAKAVRSGGTLAVFGSVNYNVDQVALVHEDGRVLAISDTTSSINTEGSIFVVATQEVVGPFSVYAWSIPRPSDDESAESAESAAAEDDREDSSGTTADLVSRGSINLVE